MYEKTRDWEFITVLSEKIYFVQVEDIVDTGNTIYRLISYLQGKRATSVFVCTLLDRPARKEVQFELLGDGKF